MSGGAFFERVTHPTGDNETPIVLIMSVLDRVDNWMGQLLYRGVSPKEIEEMDYRKMRYWGKWCEAIQKSYDDAMKGL